MDRSINLIVNGRLAGPVECDRAVTWGYVTLKPSLDGDDVAFEAALSAENEAEAGNLVGLIPAALRAFVALGWAVWVQPVITGYEFIRPDGTKKVGTQASSGWQVLVDLSKAPDPGALSAGEVQRVVLDPPDARIVELIGIFSLGLKGAQIADPLSGLWAFANVIEEESRRSNIDNAAQMAADLRLKGFDIGPDPARHASRIRAAALHPTPKDPLPTVEEIRWIMNIARSYLADRVARSRITDS